MLMKYQAWVRWFSTPNNLRGCDVKYRTGTLQFLKSRFPWESEHIMNLASLSHILNESHPGFIWLLSQALVACIYTLLSLCVIHPTALDSSPNDKFWLSALLLSQKQKEVQIYKSLSEHTLCFVYDNFWRRTTYAAFACLQAQIMILVGQVIIHFAVTSFSCIVFWKISCLEPLGWDTALLLIDLLLSMLDRFWFAKHAPVRQALDYGIR